MMHPRGCEDVLGVKPLPMRWLVGRQARLRSEGNGLSLPGPSRGNQESSYFPRVGVGLRVFRRLDSLQLVSGGYRRSGFQLEQSS